MATNVVFMASHTPVYTHQDHVTATILM